MGIARRHHFRDRRSTLGAGIYWHGNNGPNPSVIKICARAKLFPVCFSSFIFVAPKKLPPQNLAAHESGIGFGENEETFERRLRSLFPFSSSSIGSLPGREPFGPLFAKHGQGKFFFYTLSLHLFPPFGSVQMMVRFVWSARWKTSSSSGRVKVQVSCPRSSLMLLLISFETTSLNCRRKAALSPVAYPSSGSPQKRDKRKQTQAKRQAKHRSF